jgi:hypothetical protein
MNERELVSKQEILEANLAAGLALGGGTLLSIGGFILSEQKIIDNFYGLSAFAIGVSLIINGGTRYLTTRSINRDINNRRE